MMPRLLLINSKYCRRNRLTLSLLKQVIVRSLLRHLPASALREIYRLRIVAVLLYKCAILIAEGGHLSAQSTDALTDIIGDIGASIAAPARPWAAIAAACGHVGSTSP